MSETEPYADFMKKVKGLDRGGVMWSTMVYIEFCKLKKKWDMTVCVFLINFVMLLKVV